MTIYLYDTICNSNVLIYNSLILY